MVLEELEPREVVPMEVLPMEVHGRVGWVEWSPVVPRVDPREDVVRAALAYDCCAQDDCALNPEGSVY